MSLDTHRRRAHGRQKYFQVAPSNVIRTAYAACSALKQPKREEETENIIYYSSNMLKRNTTSSTVQGNDFAIIIHKFPFFSQRRYIPS